MSRVIKQFAVNMADAFTRWNLWKGGGGGGSTTLAELEDVIISNPQTDEVLQYDGNKWINALLEGGGNIGAQVDTLWSGLQVADATLTLLKNPLEYDIIVATMSPTLTNTSENSDFIMMKGDTSIAMSYIETTNYRYCSRLYNWTESNVSYHVEVKGASPWQATLKKIRGIKFAPIQPQQLYQYSYDEQVVAKWVDGRNVYEKVMEFQINGTGEISIPHNIENLDSIVSTSMQHSPETGLPYRSCVTYVQWSTTWSFYVSVINETNVVIRPYSNSSKEKVRLIIRYLKTTD